MATAPEAGTNRREEIRQRLGAIHTRMDELRAERQGEATPAAFSERIASAQCHLAASQAAAKQAAAASVRAFRRAANAHEQAALQHERAAAAGFGDRDRHERLAAVHRAAAVADTQRAECAESLLRDETPGDARGPAMDQALHRRLNVAARCTTDPPPLTWKHPGRGRP